MPPHDNSSDGKPPATDANFAHLVTALRARPQPRKPRRRGEVADTGATPQQQPPPIAEQLDRAEICSRSGRIDEAISICNALRPSLLVGGDKQSIGWCDFVLALSHLNAGRAKEAVIAGYSATSRLAPGTQLLRALTVLDGAVEVIGHEEASAKEVVAEFVSLFFGEAPLADLNGVEPGPVVYFVAVVEVDGLLDGAGVDAGEAADGC